MKAKKFSGRGGLQHWLRAAAPVVSLVPALPSRHCCSGMGHSLSTKILLWAGGTCLYFALTFQRDKRLPPLPTPSVPPLGSGLLKPHLRLRFHEVKPWQSREASVQRPTRLLQHCCVLVLHVAQFVPILQS